MRKSSGEPQIHQHWHHWLREPRPALTFLLSEKNKPVFARATLGLLFAGERKSNWYTGTSFPYTIAPFTERSQSFVSRRLGHIGHHGKAKMFLFFLSRLIGEWRWIIQEKGGIQSGKRKTGKDGKLLDSTTGRDLSGSCVSCVTKCIALRAEVGRFSVAESGQ